ncbi:cytochrome p450 3a4-like [Plakobranchus ocellatus]|uniref:Cytochrome p450 3a4-like n=1 Tax=Plakobranchus ocellatus TaxID=259542 RepID=A0AAV4AUL3_9GAST|nr:cytochrome p450 3a4-like [Plakobranchus ocellatus]
MDRPDTFSSFGVNTSVALIFATVAIVVYFLTNRLSGRQRWERYGVKHVDAAIYQSPVPLWEELMQKHGPTVGIVREVPVLVTRDLDILKQVLVKDFNNFVNRNDHMPSRSPLGKGVFFLRDHDWKRIRQLMSPSFSTGKLKRISIHVQDAARSLTKVFEKCARTDTHVKLLHTTGQYSTSIIAKTAFGLQADSIGEEEDDHFTYWAKNFFKKRSKLSFFFVLFLMRFRKFRSFLINDLRLDYPDACTKGSFTYFGAVLEDAIKEREKSERMGSRHQHNDFLQSLVSIKVATDAANTKSLSGDVKNGLSDAPASLEAKNIPAVPKKTITTEEVIAQSIFTILAAYETTSTTLHFCLFSLAENPDIQEKVFQEISEVVEHDDPSQEELSRLHYLEQVIKETLRLYPPVSSVSRQAYEDRTYGNITIPAGAAVLIPIREIQRDPAIYPDPETFDPERFNEENRAKRNPLAFIPFGQGPRLCIGMRLAYLELKTALVQILRKVRVELSETTVPRKGEKIAMTYIGFPRPEKPILLAVKLRDGQC